MNSPAAVFIASFLAAAAYVLSVLFIVLFVSSSANGPLWHGFIPLIAMGQFAVGFVIAAWAFRFRGGLAALVPAAANLFGLGACFGGLTATLMYSFILS
ncbi:MAG: hypothetical protein AAF797_08765 [Planctomycetota bacterium]